MEEEKKLEVSGKKAVEAAGLGEGRRVLGRRKGQAGQNYRLPFPKLLAERPARGRPEVEGGWWWRGTAGVAYPHAGLGEVGPHGDLFARTHVGVAVSLKGRLQLLQLLAGEVRALPPLLFLQRAVFGGAAG